MADMISPVSPLEDVLVPGRFGRSLPEGPGVTLSLLHPCEVVTVIAAKGKTNALATAFKKDFGITLPETGKAHSARGMTVCATGPDQWLAISPDASIGSLGNALADKLSRNAMITDQSHGRTVIALSGPRARDVLAKGTAMDLRPASFGKGSSAATQIGHVGVTIAYTGDDSFILTIGRTFVEGFWLGLCELALEWGYEAR